MTYTQPQIDGDFNIILGEDIEIRVRKMAAAGQNKLRKILLVSKQRES